MKTNKQEWAILFHNTYERLAPSFGYETRKDTKEFDSETPNGKLMIAVCNEVITQAQQEILEKAMEEVINGDEWISQAPPTWNDDNIIGFNQCKTEVQELINKLREEI